MPKVLRIINRFNLGGPTFNAALLTKYLAPNYETLLVGGREEDSEENSNHILNEIGVQGHLIDGMHRDVDLKNDRIAYKHIKKIIRDFKPDIIHTHASKAGAIGRSAGIAYGKAKMVHTFHGHVFHSYFGRFKSSLYKNIERALAMKTDKIVAISEQQKHDLTRKYRICNANKIEVIPLGFELDKFQKDQAEKRKQFRNQFMLEEDEIAVGIIGRLVPIKNHKLFIDAFNHSLENSRHKIRGFIIGDGSEREDLKQYSAKLGIDFVNGDLSEIRKASLHFTSWIKQIDTVTAGLDIVALSSLNEGTPVSLIEAQAAGRPIITTNAGGVENTVIAGETAIVSEVNDRKGFEKGFLELIENAELRKKLSQKSWAHAKHNFHYSRLVDDMDRLYQSLLS
jgi:glycosyltransferase involved in cell wall biosynthesis